MATEFLLPNLGEDIDEADVLKVLIAPGDTVTLEQPVLEIETDKATLDVPSSFAGTIVEIHVAEGETIHPGQLIITIDEAGGAAPVQAAATAAETASEAPSDPSSPEPANEPAPVAAEPVEERQPAADAPAPATAAADPPPGGAEAPAAAEASASPPTAPAPPAAPPPAAGGQTAFAAPSVRKFAREVGVDIARVAGSGPGGRISEDDVKRHARSAATAPDAAPDGAAPATATPSATPLPDFSRWGEVDREPLTRFRRTVVRNMTESWTQIPHFWLHHTVDVTELEEMRQNFKERAREAGGSLTITVIMLKIVASALKANPKFNASLDTATNELVLKRYCNVGVAMDTDRGLVVPVLRNVDEKNIVELSVELTELSQRARDNELSIDDMRGGTFTLTNLGGLGTGHFTAVIHHPEVAIIGLGRAQQTPVLNDEGEWEPRLIMPITIGCDHRVIDGADGARFLNWIAEAIDQPLLLAL